MKFSLAGVGPGWATGTNQLGEGAPKELAALGASPSLEWLPRWHWRGGETPPLFLLNNLHRLEVTAPAPKIVKQRLLGVEMALQLFLYKATYIFLNPVQ